MPVLASRVKEMDNHASVNLYLFVIAPGYQHSTVNASIVELPSRTISRVNRRTRESDSDSLV